MDKSELLRRVNSGADIMANRVAIAAERSNPQVPHPLVNISPRVLKMDDSPISNPECKTTNQQYFVKYKPAYYKHMTPVRAYIKPFMVRCDLLENSEDGKGGYRRFASADEFFGSEDPWVQWVIRHTNVSRKLFEIAERNEEVSFAFSVDWSGLAGEQGSDVFTIEGLLKEEEEKKEEGKCHC